MAIRTDSLRRYLDLLVGSLDEDVPGDELARRAYLSRFHFDRLLRAAVGEPPGALRRRLLLERAAYRLTTSGATATDIAFESGYESLGAFTRAFGRAFGEPPSAHRAGRGPHWLSAPNGVHFHPPGKLTVPNSARRTLVTDLTDRLIAHDLWLIDELLQRAAALTDAELDQPLDVGQTNVEELGVTTLRELLDHLVFTKETWTASIAGRAFDDAGRQTTLNAMRERLAQVGPEFQTIVRGVHERGDWDNAFIDVQCDPPETFTYAGAIAHVITFSAHRRELAIGAMRSLGIHDLGYGDPIEWERQRSTR